MSKVNGTAKLLERQNALLMKQNGELIAKRTLTEGIIKNSLSQLGAGLLGGIPGQSPLTSMNPTLQNNQYFPVTMNWTMLMYMYKTHGIIQTAIDMPVLDALRGGLEITCDQLGQDGVKELEDGMEEAGDLQVAGDGFTWARLFGGGAIIANAESDANTPLDESNIGKKLEFYDACRWELGATSRLPANGKYQFYGKTIDASRVLTIVGKRAPFILRAQLSDWGMSEVERMMEAFNLWLRTNNVVYELLQEAKVDVYSLEGFKSQLASPTGTQLTQQRIQTMNQIKDFNNALLLDKSDTYEQKQISFGGLADVLAQNRIGIASALRMPLSKIFGMSAAGFNSGEDDIENYNAMVESEVRQPMKRILRKMIKLRMQLMFGDVYDFDFKFKPLRILSAKDEEDIKRSKSDRYVALYDRMLMSSKEVGEAMQKDGMVPVALEAEKGLLEDHPAPAVTGVAEGENGAPKEEKYAPSPKSETGVKQ